MEFVEPIRDIGKIKEMYDMLADQHTRNAFLFKLGINTNLRISDILSLKVQDVKEIIKIQEKKTLKKKSIYISNNIYNSLLEYININKLYNNSYLFYSLKHNRGSVKLDRTNAWRFLKNASTQVRLNHFGTHSLRKTFGYHYYKKTNDIATLMILLNHTSIASTLHYIGITQDRVRKAYEDMSELYGI